MSLKVPVSDETAVLVTLDLGGGGKVEKRHSCSSKAARALCCAKLDLRTAALRSARVRWSVSSTRERERDLRGQVMAAGGGLLVWTGPGPKPLPGEAKANRDVSAWRMAKPGG